MVTEKYELIFGVEDLPKVAQTILKSHQNIQVITLQGTLGAGKTTFAIELLKQLGVRGEMQSPTYTYVQLYKNDEGQNFYHFDLYRLPDKDAFLFAGFDEFLYQPNSLTLIEWPEIVVSLLDRNVCTIQLDYVDDVTRKISWSCR
ncbi:tRNA (adenosine(37)-N6)-threonylcarbamoyltransferase complex ATPase subunit type 1 TsaE [Candidatus Babeliales bacterium]|nr:tRNA (adenosine(37)-N6)-threonylcarbamoyltransferase complex ATPase subunit type 1 TsaE [Candidatus Babeliales bacterium]MBP9843643.1 tRNA (adenosine(37)-N6)-threonylcarbamoyltransferase complex ATPase subunit type 1 TsaE [Candidatus Babeliales bacterium]